MTTTTNKGHNMAQDEITIVHLPGNFIKARGVGRIHALTTGTWVGRLNGREVEAADEAAAVELFSAACAVAALAGVLR
jgi:hypothetical protein